MFKGCVTQNKIVENVEPFSLQWCCFCCCFSSFCLADTIFHADLLFKNTTSVRVVLPAQRNNCLKRQIFRLDLSWTMCFSFSCISFINVQMTVISLLFYSYLPRLKFVVWILMLTKTKTNIPLFRMFKTAKRIHRLSCCFSLLVTGFWRCFKPSLVKFDFDYDSNLY